MVMGKNMGASANTKNNFVDELRSESEWDSVWKKANLPNTLNRKSLFGFHFDKLMKKHLRKGGKLIEIGCAGGKFLVYFKQEFDCDVYGVDYSPEGCKLAEKNLELANIQGTIICDDIFRCENLEKGFFDVVFSGGFIEHFDDTEAVLKKHVDFLKIGGKLVIELPNMLGLHGYMFKLFNKQLYYRHKLLTAKMVEQCFLNLGIQMIESKYIGSLILESGGKPLFIQPFFCLVNKIFYFVFKTLNLFFQSERISPYIVVIGEK